MPCKKGRSGLIESSVAVFVCGHKQLSHLLRVYFERPDARAMGHRSDTRVLRGLRNRVEV